MKRLLLIVLLLVPVMELAAEETSDIKPGARVRYKRHPDSPWVEGTVVALDADTLVLRRRKEGYLCYILEKDTLMIPLASTTKFEVEVSKGAGCLLGATGFCVGAGLALGFWSSWRQNLSAEDEHELPEWFGSIVLGSMIGAGTLGALIGVGIGSYIQRWEPAPLPVRVSLMPHGGVQVAVRFEFGR